VRITAFTGFGDRDRIFATSRRPPPGEPPASTMTKPSACSISVTLPIGCRWKGSAWRITQTWSATFSAISK
jgi:hypothetical protein